MRLFGAPVPAAEPEVSRALNQRIDELESAHQKLDKKQKQLELEWDEWYDKFRLMYARLSKRMKDAETPAEDAPGPTISPSTIPQYPPRVRRNY